MRKMSQTEKELARKFRLIATHRKNAKLHYDAADGLFEELLKEIPDLTKPHRLLRNGRKIARFKDNFADRNTAFRAHGIKRFELEIVDLAPRG